MPETATAWQDRHGDVWTEGDDGLMHTPETAPFPREHVEKKWGPLIPVVRRNWPTAQHPAAPETETDANGLTEAITQVVVEELGLIWPDEGESMHVEVAQAVERIVAERVRVVEGERDAAERAVATNHQIAQSMLDRAIAAEAAHEAEKVALWEKRCVFCPIIEGDAPANIIERGERHIAFVPIGPHVNGHVLFVPTEHLSDATVNPERTGAVVAEASRYVAERGLSANIITSVGTAATQSVPHLHVHVIPRGPQDGLDGRWPWLPNPVPSAGGEAR